MKSYSKFGKDEDKKQSISAASQFQSSSMMAPPDLSLSANATSTAKDHTSARAKTNNMVLKSQQQQLESNDNHEDDKEKDDPTPYYANVNPTDFFSAISSAFEYFKSTSYFQNININGVLASSGPGVLKGINIKSMIKADSNLLGLQGADKHFVKAATDVIGDAFEQWKAGVLIPNQMWYPAFQFIPAPVAPMMPNVPTMLNNLPSFGEHLLNNASTLAQLILAKLPSEMHNSVNGQKIQAIAEWTKEFFFIERQSTLISGVLGHGHVPGFQPPFSFGGPVQNGKVVPTPGVLK